VNADLRVEEAVATDWSQPPSHRTRRRENNKSDVMPQILYQGESGFAVVIF
jgi:hypothetical protein